MEDERYSNDSRSKPEALHGMCYTPERLVRSQEYRILAPSPRYLSISQPKIVQQKENLRKGFCCRRQLNCFTDSKQPGMYSGIREREREGEERRIVCRMCNNGSQTCSDANLPSANLNIYPAIVSDLVKFRGLPICEIGSLHAR